MHRRRLDLPVGVPAPYNNVMGLNDRHHIQKHDISGTQHFPCTDWPLLLPKTSEWSPVCTGSRSAQRDWLLTQISESHFSISYIPFWPQFRFFLCSGQEDTFCRTCRLFCREVTTCSGSRRRCHGNSRHEAYNALYQYT